MFIEHEIRELHRKLDAVINFLRGLHMANFDQANQVLSDLKASSDAQTPVVKAAADFISTAESKEQAQVDALTNGMVAVKSSVDAATKALSDALNPPPPGG